MAFFQNKLNSFTFTFFGIEDNLWSAINAREQKKMHTMSLYIILFFCASLLGLFEFFMLLTSAIGLAIPLCIVFAVVLLNIIRFSIFTIQNPICRINNLETNITSTDNSSQITNSVTPIVVPTILEKVKSQFNRVQNLLSFATMIRIIISFTLLLFIVLPLNCLLNYNYTSKINEEKRNTLITDYQKQLENNFKLNCLKIDRKIAELQTKYRTSNSTIFLEELNTIKAQKKINVTDWKSNNQIALQKYIENNNQQMYIIHSYRLNSKHLSFYALLVILGVILLRCHLLKFQLVNNTQYSYFKLANEQYFQMTLANYKVTENQIKQALKLKYSNLQLADFYEEMQQNSYYLDPPFNTKINKTKTPSQNLTPIAFLNTFSIK